MRPASRRDALLAQGLDITVQTMSSYETGSKAVARTPARRPGPSGQRRKRRYAAERRFRLYGLDH